MPKVSLRKITNDNYNACMLLEVSENQKSFVASNSWSIAQWKFNPEFFPWVIYADETIVGFMMYEFDNLEEDDDIPYAWFFRFMIGKEHQKNGYGRSAFQFYLEKMGKEPKEKFQKLGLSLEPENKVAIKFYESFGFKNTGKILGNELIFSKERADHI